MDELAASVLRFIADPKSQPIGDNEMFARLVVEKPLMRVGEVWVASRHDVVSALARHPNCVLRMPDGWSGSQHADDRIGELLEGLLPIQPTADHRRLRRLVSGGFSAKSISGLRPVVQSIVDELFAEPLERGECEFIGEVCGPLPVYTTVAMLGLPEADRPQVFEWARAVNALVLAEVTGRFGGWSGAAAPSEAGTAGLTEVVGYVEDLVRRRLADPGEDLISRLARESSGEDGKLSHAELVSMVLTLFMAGIDTVGSGLANVVTALDQNPEAWRRVVVDPSLARAAYVEGTRLLPALPMMGRIVDADVELHGIVIPAGSTVLLMYGAANLDPAAFTDPTRFDLDRTETNHLSFGHGPHYCLGAGLAMLQGEIVLETLARRAPGFRIVDGPAERRGELAFHSRASMRLRFASGEPLVGAVA
ncbi:cytochrome P450 [Streptacidiphilus jiangxiensis]|uniref:Cytochrome P450 n=1 Tax=Streptacidiphilus jiangxiensis TaxID=235985 RepID=A0A1H7KQV2_STRJI|nr:cytochrome P450 [Streptacidiphilus jiangxiensis]SEK89169.1 hypothetical protein SAMN05414137_104163 [Streptacidiphilus jiangxiensis]